jgi:hypothetical protein
MSFYTYRWAATWKRSWTNWRARYTALLPWTMRSIRCAIALLSKESLVVERVWIEYFNNLHLPFHVAFCLIVTIPSLFFFRLFLAGIILVRCWQVGLLRLNGTLQISRCLRLNSALWRSLCGHWQKWRRENQPSRICGVDGEAAWLRDL